VVSFDGFRWDYADLYDAPNFDSVGINGVMAERMIPSFPTKTFPNHYTLATGLYPDHHGIIHNSFYAADLEGTYRIGDRKMVDNPAAYSGEPIWITAEKQGTRAACFFWVGSEAPVDGRHPSYWKKYDGSVAYQERVDQVMRWLNLPPRKRPGLVMLYFDEPDHTGHDVGPLHPETGRVVASVDSILGQLRKSISGLDFSEKVNLIVLSDHGMGPVSPERYINLSEHLGKEWTIRVVGGNPVYLVEPVRGFADSITDRLNHLEGVHAWKKEEIPGYWHYGENPRFPGILVVADSLWSIGTDPGPPDRGGAHGYDNTFTDMHTIFLAEGSAFKKGYITPPFENVEVYGIIARVLGLEPASYDGNIENVIDIFAD
jgi:alkaline phosphatase D